MSRLAIALVLSLAAISAYGNDDAEKLQAFRDLNSDDRMAFRRGIDWHFGYFEIHALGTDFRITYLPLLAPLPGARLEDGAKIPNAFELTGTPYANTPPPMFDKNRSWAVEREYKRIRKLTANNK
jgi:hypothetical protein